MSTSSPFRRLQSIFAVNKKSSSIAIEFKSPKPTFTSSKSITGFNQKPHPIVNYFIKSSQSPSFRRQHSNYEAAVRRLVTANHFSGVVEIIEHQKHYPDIRNEFFVARLILLYGQAKMYDHARKLFDEMPGLNCPCTVFSFNALLEACVQSGNYDKISGLFRELPLKLSIELNVVSYNIAIKALCKVGSLDSAVFVMGEIEKNGIKPNIVTFNTLLHAFYERKKFSEAEHLWAVMEERNIVPGPWSYNLRLQGLVTDNQVSKAIQFFEEMVKNGVKPDTFSYNAMVKMCVDDGNWEDAIRWYEKMVKNGCLPDFATFGMLIAFACDTGRFDFARRLCVKAIESGISVYNSTLQRVVDGLVELSKIDKAKELVKVAKSYKPFKYDLSLPVHR